ncbi:unnamed protein product, partial [Prunus brigantina]
CISYILCWGKSLFGMGKQQASIDGVQKRHKLNPDKDVRIGGESMNIIGYELNYDPSQIYLAGKIYFKDGKEREARFFKFENSQEELAKKIFTRTSNLTYHEGFLKPYFVSYYEPQDIWILCYPQFDQLLGEMMDEDFVMPMRTEISHILSPWWCNAIRKLLGTIKHIHFCDFFHMGLNKTCNYVVVSNRIKIINVENNFEDLGDTIHPTKVRMLRIKDLKALRNMLKERILLPEVPWLERDYFFDFFDHNENYEYCTFIEKLEKHPFSMTSKERMQSFFEIRVSVNESKLKRILDGRAFHEYRKWNNKIEDMAPFKKIYEDPNNKYDGDCVWDLLEFLKDVYLDCREQTFEAVDAEVERLYPRFLNQIHTIS